MASVRILIVENEILISDEMALMLESVGYEIVDQVTTGEEAIESALSYSPDLIIMDIELDGNMDGVAAMHAINKHHLIPVIYLTQFHDHLTVQRAIKTKPAAYMSKPFNLRSMSIAIDIALHNATSNKPTFDPASIRQNKYYLLNDRVFVRERQAYKRVEVDDILWIEAERAYLRIITAKKIYSLATSMAGFSRKFQHSHLVQIHRSYIININHVKGLEGNIVYMEGGEKISRLSGEIKAKDGKLPISKHFRKEFLQRLPLI